MALSLTLPALKRRPEPGVVVSAGVHAALLAAVLIGYSLQSFPEAQEGIPVEIVTDNQYSEITKGEKSAKEVLPTPKPRADRVAETIEERDPGEAKRDVPTPPKRPQHVQVADADQSPPPALRTEIDKPDPPAPPARPDTAKADAAKAEAAKAQAAAAKETAAKEAAAKAEVAKREELAELIRQEEAAAKAEAKAAAEAKAQAAAEAKAQAAAKAKALADARAKAAAEATARRQAELADKFSAGDIRQLLASKEPASSTGSTGREVQRTASLGATSGTSQRLNPSQRDALIGLLRSQIERCYSAPPGASQGVILPVLDIRLNVDGSLTTDPRILRPGQTSVARSIAEAAVRAVRRCAPYRIPAQFTPFYNDWKAINAEFELPIG